MVKRFAEVNDITICYEVKGEGEPLLLVHGFGSEKESWNAQFEPLSEHFKVIRFDNRGAGESERPNQPYQMETFADDAAALLNQLNIKKTNIVGWSLGGMVVQQFAVMYPERIKKIVLINTLPKWPGEEKGLNMYKNDQIAGYHRKMEDPKAAFFEGARLNYSRKFRKKMEENPQKTFHGLFSAQDLIDISVLHPATPQDIKNYTHALKTYDVMDKLSEIEEETLIITAEKDRITPLSMNKIIHKRIPNSKLIVLEGVGHGSPREKAPTVNTNIIEFLKK